MNFKLNSGAEATRGVRLVYSLLDAKFQLIFQTVNRIAVDKQSLRLWSLLLRGCLRSFVDIHIQAKIVLVVQFEVAYT